MNRRECVKGAIDKVRCGTAKAQGEGHLMAFVDGKLFEAPVNVVSYPGTKVLIAIMHKDGSDHIIDFAVDTDVESGRHLIQLYDLGGKVTAGYSIEKDGEPSLNYVADLGGAEILYSDDGMFSGSFIVRLESNDNYKSITGVKFWVKNF